MELNYCEESILHNDQLPNKNVGQPILNQYSIYKSNIDLKNNTQSNKTLGNNLNHYNLESANLENANLKKINEKFELNKFILNCSFIDMKRKQQEFVRIQHYLNRLKTKWLYRHYLKKLRTKHYKIKEDLDEFYINLEDQETLKPPQTLFF